jgi:cytochrome c peroxidase
MRQRERLLWGCASCVLTWCLLAGCQRIDPYKGLASIPGPGKSGKENTGEKKDSGKTTDDKSGEKKQATVRAEVLPGETWQAPANPPAKQTPLVFVTSDNPRWSKLTKFWNPDVTLTPAGVGAALPGGAPPVGPLGQITKVEIKVPLGLDNPSSYIPLTNPATLEKWELGKKLFFDESYLKAGEKLSCAGCHIPEKAFTDGRVASIDEPPYDSKNTPTLINVVYNAHQFWDGRADALEQVVQLHREDEVESTTPHSWPGVIKRLRQSKDYPARFQKVFGTPPTQDAVGKAVATYLRTVLLGDSLHDQADQARRERKATAALDWTDYSKVLTGSKVNKAEDKAREIFKGYQLFSNVGERKAGCITCHTNFNFTDNSFHNVGIGDSVWLLGQRPSGHFRTLPPGLKDPAMIGAYKTPTLRALKHTRPYFHNGGGTNLNEVVLRHLQADTVKNPYLDPELKEMAQRPADKRLKDDEINALVQFLEALEGLEIAPELSSRPQ